MSGAWQESTTLYPWLFAVRTASIQEFELWEKRWIQVETEQLQAKAWKIPVTASLVVVETRSVFVGTLDVWSAIRVFEFPFNYFMSKL